MQQDNRTFFDHSDLLRSASGTLFFDQSPRLPAPPMLMIDRVVAISANGGAHNKGHVIAELDIDPSAWFFNGHFLDDPVMPGCLGVDALWQLTGFNLGWRGLCGQGRALGTDTIKFSRMITPENKRVTYYVDFTRVMTGNLKLGIANGRVVVDDELAYDVKGLKVGLFTKSNQTKKDTP